MRVFIHSFHHWYSFACFPSCRKYLKFYFLEKARFGNKRNNQSCMRCCGALAFRPENSLEKEHLFCCEKEKEESRKTKQTTELNDARSTRIGKSYLMHGWIDCSHSVHSSMYIFVCLFPVLPKILEALSFSEKARFENKRKAGLQAIHTTATVLLRKRKKKI